MNATKQVDVWGQRAKGNGQRDLADRRVGGKVEVQEKEGARPDKSKRIAKSTTPAVW